jgi:hypothetical protein
LLPALSDLVIFASCVDFWCIVKCFQLCYMSTADDFRVISVIINDWISCHKLQDPSIDRRQSMIFLIVCHPYVANILEQSVFAFGGFRWFSVYTINMQLSKPTSFIWWRMLYRMTLLFADLFVAYHPSFFA